NVEITPELAVRLASAYATMLRKGSSVTTSRDASRAARALKRAVISALTASAINVRDLEVAPTPVTRFDLGMTDSVGGITLRTTPGDPQSIDIVFLDSEGADLSLADQRKLERVFYREEFRRAFPGEIAELTFAARSLDQYTAELMSSVDVSGVRDSGLKVVVDASGGTTSIVLPALLGKLGVDVLTINGRVDELSTTESLADHMRGIERLGELVASSRATFGVRFDHAGERIAIVDERGVLIHDDRALLVVLELVSAERKSGAVALPVHVTRVAEQIATSHGVGVVWSPQSAGDLLKLARSGGIIFAGDGRGGMVIPEFTPALDGLAAFVRLAGLLARSGEPLSAVEARIPAGHVVRRSAATPWATKGLVMRSVVEAAGSRALDTTEGVRIIEDDGSWVLVLPDPSEAVTHLWAEGPDPARASALLQNWGDVVESAGR
ncbi:MAG: hypothetical protein ABIM89_19510, partial [Mycobacteriales bacterium]